MYSFYSSQWWQVQAYCRLHWHHSSIIHFFYLRPSKTLIHLYNEHGTHGHLFPTVLWHCCSILAPAGTQYYLRQTIQYHLHRFSHCLEREENGQSTQTALKWAWNEISYWAWNEMSYRKYIFSKHVIDLILNNSFLFYFDLIILNQNVRTWSSSEKPCPIQLTASLNSDLPPSDQQPMDRPPGFFSFSIIRFTGMYVTIRKKDLSLL